MTQLPTITAQYGTAYAASTVNLTGPKGAEFTLHVGYSVTGNQSRASGCKFNGTMLSEGH